MFIVSYQFIDSAEDGEREFPSLAEARTWVASNEGFLQWHVIEDESGEEY